MYNPTQSSPGSHAEIARLLANRYGDGGIYLPRSNGMKKTLRTAIDAGFVSADGFVTRKGRALLARSSSYPNLRG